MDELIGSPGHSSPSNLNSLTAVPAISSPLKEALSSSDNARNNPYYEQDWFDEHGVHWVRFKKIEDPIVVSVSKDVLSKVLNFSITENGYLAIPTFVKKSSRAEFMKTLFNEVTPNHFFNRHSRDNIHRLAHCSGKQQGKRGGKDKKHPFLVHFIGNCHGRVDGCTTCYDSGVFKRIELFGQTCAWRH